MDRPPIAIRILTLAFLLAMTACAQKRSPGDTATALQDGPPPPPPAVLARITVGPLPQAFSGLTALGRALGSWDTEEDVFFDEIRALAEGLSELGKILNWEREAHLLILDEKRLQGRFALLLPVERPEEALRHLSERCQSTRQGGVWHFTGSSGTLLPCRFFVRPVPGGLVVTPKAILADALGRYGHALMDPRLGAPIDAATRRPGSGTQGEGPETANAPLLEVRAFVPALMERFGIDEKKVAEWVTLGAMAIAMASGDFLAAGGIKENLDRLLVQVSSMEDVGLALELGAAGVTLRLFATGRPKGALTRWINSRRTPLMGLHRRIEPGAAVALAIAGPHKEPAKGGATSPRASSPTGATSSGPSPASRRKSALSPLVSILLARLPLAYRSPAKRLWESLTGPGRGELALALGHPGEGAIYFDLLFDHAQPDQARAEVLEATLALLNALRDQLAKSDQGGSLASSGASAPARAKTNAGPPISIQVHRGSDVDRIDVLPAPNPAPNLAPNPAPNLAHDRAHDRTHDRAHGRAPALGAALRLLFGAPSLSIAVAHRDGRVALSLGPKAEARALGLLKNAAPRLPRSTGSRSTGSRSTGSRATDLRTTGPRALGRLALSLVELGRLLPGVWPQDAPKPKDAGALFLHWGTDPAQRRLELVFTLPSAHLRALAPLTKELTARLESSTSSLSSLLGLPDEAEDAL